MTKFSEFASSLVIHCLRFPRSIVNRISVPCGMRISAEKMFFTMRVNVLQFIPRSFPQVSLIDRAPQLHLSTLEKTKIDRNPLLNNLVVTVSQVSPIYRHLQQIFQDLDIHTSLMKNEEDTTEGILAVKFIISLDLAVTRSSPDPCWARFAVAAELKWLMLNKFNKWFHSSRVKFPLVKMSTSWFLVPMYLIWILGSRLIRSNNQSRATLWVLETCLIVGLQHLIIILITASLSSKHIQ